MRSPVLLLLAAHLALVSGSPVEAPRDAGLTIALQKRSRLHDANGVVNMEALKGQLARIQHKYARTLRAYESNTGKVHKLAETFFANHPHLKRASGEDRLTDYWDAYWYGSVQVGTPQKTFTADFDTGSSDFFLPSSSCQGCGRHTTYNPSSSSTSRNLGKSFHLSYGDNSETSGNQYSDTVSISGLSVAGQTLGAATSYSSEFQQTAEDGLMGLGWPALSHFPATPYIFNLFNQGTMSSGSFSFKLSASGASLYIGGADSSQYSGSFSYTPVTSQAYWEVITGSLGLGSTIVATNADSIVDSGTTLIYVDASTARAFYSHIPGAREDDSYGTGIYTMPCNNIPNNVDIVFAGRTVNIPPSVFNYGQTDDVSNTCVGSIAAGNFGFWILGDTFMRNVYTTFDMANARVGIASLA